MGSNMGPKWLERREWCKVRLEGRRLVLVEHPNIKVTLAFILSAVKCHRKF